MVYKIIIENNTSNDYSPVAGQETASVKDKESRDIKAKDIGLFVAYKKAKPFISQVVSNEVQKIGLRTGSNRLQEKANFYHSVASSVISFGESILLGGKVGGAAGAVVGAVLSSAHSLIGVLNNQDKIDISRAVENESIRMNNVRAGAKGSRRA